MSHMSMLGACWHRPILGGKSILGMAYFWRERYIFGAQTYRWTEKKYFWSKKEGKEACIKRRKSNMQKEEKQHGAHADIPNHVRVRVLDKNVMAII
jgi:hypothetical protein